MVKYRVLYRDDYNNLCRVDISKESYEGDPIILRGLARKACVITYDVDTDPYEPIVNTKASINVHQEENLPIDILELQQADDRDFRVSLYIKDAIQWTGFLIPDGIQQTFQSAPYDLNLTATDGLKLLNDIKYTHNNLDGGRCPINYFRQILFSANNLGLPLPIRWVANVTNPAFPGESEVFASSVKWSSRGEGFNDYNGDVKSCLYILENMLRSFQCRIYQYKGMWKIDRVNDITTGEYRYHEIGATLDGFDVQYNILTNVLKNIGSGGNYSFIEEDAILTVLPPLNEVKTTYDQTQRENILPNGNMDITSLGAPIYWGVNEDSTAVIGQYPSLSSAKGSAVKVTNISGQPDCRLELIDGELPIDTDVLYTYINIGFKFMIITGAVVDSNGFIVWAQTPFEFMLRYDDGEDFWYLNEFGFWTKDASQPTVTINIPNLKLNDVAQVDFNARQNIIMPLPAVTPIVRTRPPSLYIAFYVPGGREVVFDDIYINTDTNSDVYVATNNLGINTKKQEYTLNISSNHNGFHLSNYMTDYSQSGLEKFFTDSKSTGVLTELNSRAIMRNRYKSSLQFEGSILGNTWSYGEIYNIQTLPGINFMPMRCSWNTEINTINVSLVEVRDDDIALFVDHYGSNDKTKQSN